MTDDLVGGAPSPRPIAATHRGPFTPRTQFVIGLKHDTRANTYEEGGDRHVDFTGTLTTWLGELAQRFKGGDHPDLVVGPFGAHAVRYGENDEDGYGPYAVVSFSFSEPHELGWFSEIEDGTYGQLMGFRIYLNEPGHASC